MKKSSKRGHRDSIIPSVRPVRAVLTAGSLAQVKGGAIEIGFPTVDGSAK